MRFALLFPTRAVNRYDEWMGSCLFTEIGRLVEASGFDALALTDHPFPPDDWVVNDGGHHSFDPFVGLSFIGAATTRLKLLTYVLVAGYRNPYLTAKAVASLDKLSRGRAVLGMAAGYLQPEFEALGAIYERRGERFDAAIDAMRAAWTGEAIERDDVLFSVRRHSMRPRPVQEPGPPIWIGGNSAAARRRAIERADGWMPFHAPVRVAEVARTDALVSLEELTALVAFCQDERARRGAGPLDIVFTPIESLRDAGEGADAIAANLDVYEAAGVTWLIIEPRSRNVDEFASDVETIGHRLVRPSNPLSPHS